MCLALQEAEEESVEIEFLEEETEAAEAKTATLQSRASVASLEEMEEEMRSRKGTFSGEGELLNLEDEPTVEGFVQMKGSFF